MARVVVVGGGVSGLATAAWLADFGHEVTVCEQAASIGGRLGGLSHGEQHFDLTPGPLTVPAVFRDLFRKTGRPLERVVDLLPLEPAIAYRFPDGVALNLPHASRAGAVEALDGAFGVGAGAEWQAAVRYGGEIWARVRSPYLEAAATRRELARLTRSRRRGAVGADRSLRALGQEIFTDPGPARMLEHAASGTDPRKAPAGLAAIAYLHQTFGRWTVGGGMRRLSEAIGDRAADCGATVRTGARVTKILVEGRRATGVQLVDGEAVGADVVVSAVDIGQLYDRLLPDGLARRDRRRQRGAVPSPGRFTVFMALRPGRDDERPDAHHTVLFAPSGDAELTATFGTHAEIPAGPTIDVYAPMTSAGTDPATEALEAWTAAVTVPGHSEGGVLAGTVDWSEPGIADAFAGRLLDLMATRGIDVRKRLSWHGHRSPYDVATQSGIEGGSSWGVNVNTLDAMKRRPLNRTAVSGLFCAGTSAYPGPGLPLVGLSAMMVADLIGRA